MTDRRRDAWAVFAVALTARLAMVAWGHDRFPAAEDGHYYDVLARRIANGSGYTWAWPDGAVTYAAHYPVGYPALLALVYVLMGPSLAVAMGLNAILGALGAAAMHRLVDGDRVARWRPLAAGLTVALHPALVPYTVALMTEGVTAALCLVAAAVALRARDERTGRPWPWIAGAGIVMGIATLVRPQSLLLAPALGWFADAPGAGARSRLLRGASVTIVALACVAPWTARNCVRMGRCAAVSVNEGWNLLIGASSETGGWSAVAVPPECATVWDEASKDACFERAAWRSIETHPGRWLAAAPAKLAMTLDVLGAAPWYLHASAPDAFGAPAQRRLGTCETIACRLALFGALAASIAMEGRRRVLRAVVGVAGALAAIGAHPWMAYLLVVLCIALAGWRALAKAPMVVPVGAWVILSTMAVHAVFFGAGRYGLSAASFVVGIAFAAAQA